MGRKKNPIKQQLIEELGASPNKNWTVPELQAMKARADAKKALTEEHEKVVTAIAGPPPNIPAAEMEIPYASVTEEDPFHGLSARQKQIARLRMRGMTQTAIGNIVGIPQPVVSQELKKIKDWQAEHGAAVDQAAVVGHARSVYEEVAQAAWLAYSQAETTGDKTKALDTVMNAQRAHDKLLTDLGLVKKAAQEVKHIVEPSPFMKDWKDGKAKKNLADSIVESQLKALPEPTMEDFIEAEIEPETNEVEIVVPKSDLAEPTLDIEESND